MSDREQLRDDALACLNRAIAAVRPAPLVRQALERESVADWPTAVHVVAVGKAAVGMAQGAAEALGERVTSGLVLTTAPAPGEVPSGFETFTGGHPVADADSVRATTEILERVGRLAAGDCLLFLLSGGASALLTRPQGRLHLEDVKGTTQALLRAGADIRELNTVRKHLDSAKGGRLAEAAMPAQVLALVLSDVVGDPLDVIGSGPFSPDPSTYGEALEVLERRGLWRDVPRRVRELLLRGREGEEPETPKEGARCFENVRVAVVGNNRLATEAAMAEASRRGYRAMLLTTRLTGEAREVGAVLAAMAREVRESGAPLGPPACLVASGETTVTVRGGGRGGRNQELTLGAALGIEGMNGVAIASVGTDGVDGPTDAAGGIAYGDSIKRARNRGLDARRHLADNDSHTLLKELDDLVTTGDTGTNVMDLQLVLVRSEAKTREASSSLTATQPVAETPRAPEAERRDPADRRPETPTGDRPAAAAGEAPPDDGANRAAETTTVDGEPRAFAALGLEGPALAAVRAAGFTEPTPIQERVVPPALAGGDLVGLAETGSGKTAAFCLPLIQRLGGGSGTRAVILCPTREIALQTQRFLDTVGPESGIESVALVGGLAIGPQIRSLERGPAIAVATPGRLLDHMERRTFRGDGVRELVLDEADHMLDLGFLPQIQAILEQLPRQRRTMMFSATMPPDIERLANLFMTDACRVDLRPEGGTAAGIEHEIFLVAQDDKKACLQALLRDDKGSTLVFMRRKVDADWACRQLELDGHPVDRIHSDRSQRQRMEALQGFREGEHRILVATDVAARGIDIPRIEHIINFDLPETVEDYIHRSGRTARGHRKGKVSSIATWRDKVRIREIEAALGCELPRGVAGGVEPHVERGPRRKRIRRRLL